MAYNNGIVTAPVSIYDVQRALSDSSQDVKTLCMADNVNKWSKCKPVEPRPSVPVVKSLVLPGPGIPDQDTFKTLDGNWGVGVFDDDNLPVSGLIALSDLLKKVDLVPLSNSAELPSQIVSYVNDNFKEPLTIKSISKVFGYHPSYIAHLFCDRLKIPFRTYLGALRCEYASTQIKTTEKSLTEIAFDSGFNSLNTFCRAFKKHLGKTPSQYKKEA